MTSKRFLDINQIYESAPQLNDFKPVFEHLQILNRVLGKILPDNLRELCHVGAYDNSKSIVVVYVSSQQALHILKGMSNKILQAFYKSNYSFNNILLKVSLTTKTPYQANKALDPLAREKLAKLAIDIGKPELIIDAKEAEIDDDEIKL